MWFSQHSGQAGGILRQSNIKVYLKNPKYRYLYIFSYTTEDEQSHYGDFLLFYKALKLVIYLIFCSPMNGGLIF